MFGDIGWKKLEILDEFFWDTGWDKLELLDGKSFEVLGQKANFVQFWILGWEKVEFWGHGIWMIPPKQREFFLM
jgi:hypothetical protein